jgi:hypothetical protein
MLEKISEVDGGSNGELIVKNSKINEWEELTLILLQELPKSRYESTIPFMWT